MARHTGLMVLVVAALTVFAAAQMRPGQVQRPGAQQQPDVPPGAQPPGMQGPGMGQDQNPAAQNQQQPGPKVDDATLQRQVHQQLAANGEFANVTVTVKDGVAHLTGSVPRKEDRKLARQTAASVPGVQGVKEKLTVDPNAGSAATSTTGAETTGQLGGTAGAAAAGAGAAGAAPGTTTAAQNPQSPVSTNPSERGNPMTNAGAMGQSPCTCSPGAASPTTALPAPGAVGSSTAGTVGTTGQTATTAGAMGQSTPATKGTAEAEAANNQAAASAPIGQNSAATRGSTQGAVNQGTTEACTCPPATSSGSNVSSPSPLGSTAASTAGGTSGTAVSTTGSTPPSTSPGASTNIGGQPTGTVGSSSSSQAVSPAPATSEAAQATPDLAGQIETAFRDDPTLAKDQLSVTATDSEIVLTGTTATSRERETARRIAESFAINRKVVDKIKVGGEQRQR